VRRRLSLRAAEKFADNFAGVEQIPTTIADNRKDDLGLAVTCCIRRLRWMDKDMKRGSTEIPSDNASSSRADAPHMCCTYNSLSLFLLLTQRRH
jgi:hypothetical protein